MPTIQVEANLSPDELLAAVQQLSLPELEVFLDKARLLRAQRVAPVLSHSESALLNKINAGIPAAILDPFRELKEKQESETLTEAEHVEYMHLVNAIEAHNVERLSWLIELAQLRQQTVTDLMHDLGLPLPHA